MSNVEITKPSVSAFLLDYMIRAGMTLAHIESVGNKLANLAAMEARK